MKKSVTELSSMDMPEIVELSEGVWGCQLSNGALLAGTSRELVADRARELCGLAEPDGDK